MKKSFCAILSILFIVFCFAGCSDSDSSSGNGDSLNSGNSGQTEEIETGKETLPENKGKGIHHAELILKGYGTIKLELDENAAPITVNNFIKLAKDGFYDGLTFHRIIRDFMIQGGDPEGTGMGGAKENIKGEFAQNGVNNPISHKRGAISMARSGDPDSASSQFFICHADSTFLDGQYAAFGYVTSGMEIVDAICENVESSDNVPQDQRPVIETIKVID